MTTTIRPFRRVLSAFRILLGRQPDQADAAPIDAAEPAEPERAVRPVAPPCPRCEGPDSLIERRETQRAFRQGPDGQQTCVVIHTRWRCAQCGCRWPVVEPW